MVVNFMKAISEESTKVVAFKQGKEPVVLRPPCRHDELSEKIQKAMSENAEIRKYYKPNVNLEVIETLVPPHYQQPWHTHIEIHEAMLVVKGQVEVLIEKKKKINRISLNEGDLVVVDRGLDTFHTVRNPTNEYSTTLTFKFLGPAKKQNEIFSSDWYGRHPER